LLYYHGADVNVRGYRKRALLCDASYGRREIIEWLLHRGADPNIGGRNGWTPLHFAASRGRTEIAEILLQHRAVVNGQDIDGEIPLHLASKRRHVDLTRSITARTRCQCEFPGRGTPARRTHMPRWHARLVIQETKKGSSNRTSFGVMVLQLRTMCHTPESPSYGVLPHAFSNSISSMSIEGASGNRGVILHMYGSGMLKFTS
jgi:hypothetical protein